MSQWRRDFVRGGEALSVQLTATGDDRYRVRVGDQVYEVVARATPHGAVRFSVGGVLHTATAAGDGEQIHVRLDGRTFGLSIHKGRREAEGRAGNGQVTAPMTGIVTQVLVAHGDAVEAEQPVAVMTAMKMEHKLFAGVRGTVAQVLAQEGATVDQGELLVRVEPTE